MVSAGGLSLTAGHIGGLYGLSLKKPIVLGLATLVGCCSAAGFQLGEATLVGWCSDAVCQLDKATLVDHVEGQLEEGQLAEEDQLGFQSDVLQSPEIHVELDGAAESRSTQVEVAREALQAAHSTSVQLASQRETAELEEAAASGAAAAGVWPPVGAAAAGVWPPVGSAAWSEKSTHTPAGFVHVEAHVEAHVAAQEDFDQEVASSCRFARRCPSSRACQQ